MPGGCLDGAKIGRVAKRRQTLDLKAIAGHALRVVAL
jgi:hypothetical protein